MPSYVPGYNTEHTPQHSQASVRYRRGYPLRACGVCTMYRKGGSATFGHCTDVSGMITPYGLCDIFSQLSNPYGHRASKEHRRAIEDIYDHAHGYSSR